MAGTTVVAIAGEPVRVLRVQGGYLPMVEVVTGVVVWHGCTSPDCYVDEDGWTTCGERACPECGSPAVTVTELADGTEFGTCECGEVWQ